MEISSAAKVGMISLLALIIIGLIFTQIGDWKNRETGYEINIIFDQIGGLQPQSRVALSGVNVGKVKNITILPNHKVRVTVNITYKNLVINKNSVFTVVGTLWGEKWVEIYPKPVEDKIKGQPAPIAVLTPGAEVEGIPPVSIEQMIVEGQQALEQLRETIVQVNSLIGDPKTQKDFKGTMANFYETSKNIKNATASLDIDLKTIVAGIKANVKKIGSDISVFSGSAKRMALNNEDDMRVIVKNLKSMSHSLNLAMETIKTIVTKKEFSEDIAATLSNIKTASEEIAGIASDIRIITSDPQIKEDIKQTIHEAKQTVHGANEMFNNINGIIGGGKQESKSKLLRVDAEVEWTKTTGQAVPNLNAVFFPYGKFSLKAGADSIGHKTLYNLQGGANYKNVVYPRFGIIRSNLGIGVDTRIGNLFTVSVDAYDTQQTKVDAIGRLSIGKDFYILGGQRNMFNSQARSTIFGIGKSF